jgi:Bacterial archaeo-eukaryotic release factor family 10
MTFDEVRELAKWQPPLGVLSIYLRVEPGDRGGAWRTTLRNGLAQVQDGGDGLDHRTRVALRHTAKRVADRFANHERDLPRGEVGFVEVSSEPGDERWWATHVPPESEVTACLSVRPVVAPAIWLARHGGPLGVALVSAERVHLLEWSPGHLEELHRWELSMFSGDWREGKAQRVPDPARAQAISASGRDQFGERLADNRHRFLGECRGLALRIGSDRGWERILAFGPAQQADAFRERGSGSPPIDLGAELDLISKPLGQIEAPIGEAIARQDAERGKELAERALEEARGGVRGTAGRQETSAALDEGRVECLVLDAALAASAAAAPVMDEEAGDGAGPGTEALVKLALAGGAEVIPISGEAAELLVPVDGVAALLRY